jgi:hypothetical protein
VPLRCPYCVKKFKTRNRFRTHKSRCSSRRTLGRYKF